MEISRRPDIGGDLKAPLEASGGLLTPGYSLIGDVRAGDVVIHYDSHHEVIIGVSRATGDNYYAPIWWVARGSSAREREEKASWKPGLYVTLENYTPLSKPVSSFQVAQRKEPILRLLNDMSAKYKGSPLYPPFTKYREGIRTYQSYFAKFPERLLNEFPELQAAIDQLTDHETRFPPRPRTEAEQAQFDFEAASGRRRKGSSGKSQGRRLDPEVKAAVEAHAMNAARAHYEQLGDVANTSRGNPYDYVVMIDGEEWRIEVKGTATSGDGVLVTPNEVVNARSFPRVALFVVRNIIVEKTKAGLVASGGSIRILHPWHIEHGELIPTGYEYRLPLQ